MNTQQKWVYFDDIIEKYQQQEYNKDQISFLSLKL
jgi:hypothetical protein